jgi:hypothetical protein
MMDRVIRDGHVAVIFSPEHGAGWYSWHGVEALIFDPSIVAWIEAQEHEKILSYVTLRYPGKYFGSIDDLSIQWIPVGTEFVIDEYDGSETIRFKERERWITA